MLSDTNVSPEIKQLNCFQHWKQ